MEGQKIHIMEYTDDDQGPYKELYTTYSYYIPREGEFITFYDSELMLSKHYAIIMVSHGFNDKSNILETFIYVSLIGIEYQGKLNS